MQANALPPVPLLWPDLNLLCFSFPALKDPSTIYELSNQPGGTAHLLPHQLCKENIGEQKDLEGIICP